MTIQEDLIVRKMNRVGQIVFNRPSVLNAYNESIAKGLISALSALGNDDEVHVIVITGTGKAFMAGADIPMLIEWNRSLGGIEEAKKFFNELFSPSMIDSCPKPVIAAVNGLAFGEGCEIAMGCDIRIASDTAKFCQPEVNLGLLPGGGGTQRLRRLIGLGRSMEMLLTAKSIDAAQAYDLGLVNQVVPGDKLTHAVDEMCKKLCEKPLSALSLCKKAVLEGFEKSFDRAITYERDLFASALFSENGIEGLKAFLEKRRPNFR